MTFAVQMCGGIIKFMSVFTKRLSIYVKPLSRETKLLSESDGTLTMYVTAPPEKGKANREIVKWLSKRLGVSSSQVRIVAGAHSNKKVIEIIGVNDAELARILGISKSGYPKLG